MQKTRRCSSRTKNRKMVREQDAFEALLDLQFKVVMGNRITRGMLMNFIDSLPTDDEEMFDLIMKVLLTLVVQDEDSRFDYVEQFHGDPQYMEVYNLAIDIREVLGYNEFDDYEYEHLKHTHIG